MLIFQAKEKILKEFEGSIFRESLGKAPPVRGPFGEATIEIKNGCLPTKQRSFQVAGERREAMVKVFQKLEEEGKIERGMGSWISPAFPVAKENPGEYRLVIDYRKLNEATIMDAQPLPRIEDILVRQGKFKIWTVLDLKDGFHQIPIREDCKHFTCMSTPVGVFQWKVLRQRL
jgi:hypothetical protein